MDDPPPRPLTMWAFSAQTRAPSLWSTDEKNRSLMGAERDRAGRNAEIRGKEQMKANVSGWFCLKVKSFKGQQGANLPSDYIIVHRSPDLASAGPNTAASFRDLQLTFEETIRSFHHRVLPQLSNFLLLLLDAVKDNKGYLSRLLPKVKQ